MQDESPAPVADNDRWTLARDIAVLQVKLIVDGLRDFILVPVSLVAGIMSLFGEGNDTDNAFYRLLRVGRKSERWINLFGAADRVPAPAGEPDHFPDADIDVLVSRVESFVVEEYKSGGVTRVCRGKNKPI